MDRKLKADLKLITDDWKRRIGSRPGIVSEELQRALVSHCVMSLMATRAELYPDRPIGAYVDLCLAATKALMIDDRDVEVAKVVAEKFGL